MKKLTIIVIAMLIAVATSYAAERARLKMFGKEYDVLHCAANHAANYSLAKGFTMTFNEADMTAAEKKGFSSGVYTVEIDIAFDGETINALNAPKGAILKKGNYKIYKEGKQYRIEFGGLDSVGSNPMTKTKTK